MAKIDRFNGNLKAFGANAVGGERTVFGDVAQSDTLDANINTYFLRGWGIVAVDENPTMQDFNAMGFGLGQLIAYLHQMGVAEWNATQEYHIGSTTQVGEIIYISHTNTNVGNSPSTDDGTNWRAVLSAAAIHAATSDATLLDADEFGRWKSVSGLLRKCTWGNIVSTLSALCGAGWNAATASACSGNSATASACSGNSATATLSQRIANSLASTPTFGGSPQYITTATHDLSLIVSTGYEKSLRYYQGINFTGTVTITLPSAASYSGMTFVFRTTTNNAVVSASANVIPITGGAAGTGILPATAGSWAELVSDGSNWEIVARG
jgi:hypothetical protein